MKKIIFSVLGLLIAQLAIGQIKVKVIGKVTGDTEGHNKVYLYNRMVKDSAEIKMATSKSILKIKSWITGDFH
ncbi:hypothetical protein KUH03_11135 [Sphingobacterium sp. E70]|uniref:hypothetical protein n=1 Tax=Sphingobacterium sp. E70 TaxID=2853439 RepID=UPI00211C3FD7|nr:hypothetical protein [Sphingobacterium sp. E70]ULT27253.1 hypothetical protein KUH03_11135 [Sphingobacterium sp. E70]